MIIATAGHIDHGKTSLVKSLTGVDTDRLPEERKRGISIDLGFAHADLGERVSFIDVPGHERFIRNMLAGVCGIDAALLVVAADDGVMPQTLEHLYILDLLEVRRGAVVITKTDLVSSQRVDDVTIEVQDTLVRTSLEGAEVFSVSTKSGAGLPALVEWLRALTTRTPVHLDDARHFRMPLDRAFTVAGSGTVITGTIHSGIVSVGDRLIVSPRGCQVRVRGVQVEGASVARAIVGQRCALNLVGLGVQDVGRGDWIVNAVVHAPTSRFDARLRVLVSEVEPLMHWTPVHLHLGTVDVPARIAVPAEEDIRPGESSFIQLITDRPIVALHGDRFVVRDQSARRTLGGGLVLDPFAAKRKRGMGLRFAELQMYERRSPSKILAGLLELSDTGIDLDTFARSMNLTVGAANAVLREADALVLGKSMPVGITRTAGEALRVRVLKSISQFHDQHPQASGIEFSYLRKLVAPKLNIHGFQFFLRELANRQQIVLSNDLARLRCHETSDNPEDEKLWELVRKALQRAGVHTPLVADLSRELGASEQVLREFLHRKSRTGKVRRVTAERFSLLETLACLAAMAIEVAQGNSDGFFSAREFRDAIGTGRGLAIHYLEFFDQLGITQRFGDRRRMGKAPLEQLEGGGLSRPGSSTRYNAPR